MTFGKPVADRRRRPEASTSTRTWTVCDNTGGQPDLRTLLHRVRQLRRGRTRIHDARSSDGGLTWSAPGFAGGQPQGPRWSAGRAAQRHGHRALETPQGHHLVPSDPPTAARRGLQGAPASGRPGSASHRQLRRHFSDERRTAHGRDRRGRARRTWRGRIAASSRAVQANDIVFSTSTDGRRWTSPARVLIGRRPEASTTTSPGSASTRPRRGHGPDRGHGLLLLPRGRRARPRRARSSVGLRLLPPTEAPPGQSAQTTGSARSTRPTRR